MLKLNQLKFIRKYKKIILILALFLISSIVFLQFYSEVWWDSAVYIGMGKYLYSAGDSGLWEASRPLVLPLILGIGWKLGINPVIFGRIISLLFSSSILVMVYLIGRRLFSESAALLAAFFTACSFTFFFFSSNILTDIPSAFFILLSFYFFIGGRHFSSGICAGIAAMTRFFSGIAFISMLAYQVYDLIKKRKAFKILRFCSGTAAIILPYLILNSVMYNSPFFPFELQKYLTNTTGWTQFRSFWFYFAWLIKENYLLLLLLTIPLFFRKNKEFLLLLLTPMIYITVFSLAKHKEMRFLIAVIPFLYLLLAYVMANLYAKFTKEKSTFVMSAAIAVFVFFSLNSLVSSIHHQHYYDGDATAYFQDFLWNTHKEVWITNPIFALHSNSKIGQLLYYFSSSRLIIFLNDTREKPEFVLYSSCDMECPPEEIDKRCMESRKILNGYLSKFYIAYTKETQNCNYKIYQSIS